MRAALITACHDLLAEKPIDALTIDEIVQRANVAKGSFYSHFDGKEQLAQVIFSTIRSELELTVDRANENVDDPARRVVRGLFVYVGYGMAVPTRAILMLQASSTLSWSAQGSLNEGVRRDITAGLVAGRFTVPSVEAGIQTVRGFSFAALAAILEDPERRPSLLLSQQLASLMLRALGVSYAESELIPVQAALELLHPAEPPRP